MALVLPLMLMAQSRTAVMSMGEAELQKRGLTQTEVKARLLQNGIDVDAIPPSDYPRYESPKVRESESPKVREFESPKSRSPWRSVRP